MHTEDAGLEGLSACFALVALLFAAGGGALWRSLWTRRARPAHDHLVNLIVGFVTSEDRSLERVAQIEALLTIKFARDRHYEELTASVVAFAPRERAAFRDEAGLVQVFRAFLKKQGVPVPDEARDQSGVWPPPPKR